MKILYILSGAELYGDNRSITQLITMVKDRIEPLVCLNRYGPVVEILKERGIPYRIVSSILSPSFDKVCTVRMRLGFIRRYPIGFMELAKIVCEFKPDIIHSNNGQIYGGYILSKLFKIPHVWHLREYIVEDHGYVIRYPNFFRKGLSESHCIAISQGIFKHWKLNDSKDVQIYNGIYSQKELLPYVSTKDDYFLFCGRIVKTKGVKEMIESFAEFAKHNKSTRLLLAGEGGKGRDVYMEELKAFVKTNHLDERVEFLGFVKDMRPLMSHARALIVPSYYEALGRITIEAMLMGCFVIGKNTAGTKELLENENAGILFNNCDEMADAMLEVANMTAEEIDNHNIRVREHACCHYTSEYNAEHTFAFYNTVLSNKMI